MVKEKKRSKQMITMEVRRQVTLERKEGIVTTEGPAGDSWDAVNVLVLAWVVGTRLFYENSLSGIFM